MQTQPRFLTKTLFNLAMTCPTKLYYAGKKEYANRTLDDPFLQALADGGFQVGELAREYYRHEGEATMVNETDPDKAKRRTYDLLQKDSVVLFEPAFGYKNLSMRADILKKEGNTLRLIEVKAKSYDSAKGAGFLSKNGSVSPEWLPYLLDLAFQYFVLGKAMPGYTVKPYLMMPDKAKRCPTDGLNQRIRIKRLPDGKGVEIQSNLADEDLSERILEEVPAEEAVCALLEGRIDSLHDMLDGKTLEEAILGLADFYLKDEKIKPQPGSKCQYCEFKASEEQIQQGLCCGFRECWKESFGLTDGDFNKPLILDLWNFRKKDELISRKKIFLADLGKEDLPKPKNKSRGLTTSERQWLQIEKAVSGDSSPYIDKEGLKSEMRSWRFPLHFIDFETATVAVPFNKGRRPYEAIAFQFSHHVVERDGSVRHAGQFIESSPGVFPNYSFVRALKSQLEKDDGTIFRYGAHENTYLNFIAAQLQDDPLPPADASDLISFIREITETRNAETREKVAGPRNMVDMLELVKRYYYDPAMKGSNSIKAVLPAMLNGSAFLQEFYGRPVYGAKGGIKSFNFMDWTWVKKENGRVCDPYGLLPKIFEGLDKEELEDFLSCFDEIHEGGTATMAWCRMQFSEMSDSERKMITEALLKYCELDTLAMVMIYQGWADMVRILKTDH